MTLRRRKGTQEQTDKTLDVRKQQKAKPQADKETLNRQVTATDKQIDDLVYVYELTEGEIAVVEGRAK